MIIVHSTRIHEGEENLVFIKIAVTWILIYGKNKQCVGYCDLGMALITSLQPVTEEGAS